MEAAARAGGTTTLSELKGFASTNKMDPWMEGRAEKLKDGTDTAEVNSMEEKEEESRGQSQPDAAGTPIPFFFLFLYLPK